MHLETCLIINCITLLEQGARVLERIDDEVYAKYSVLSPRAAIGTHLRHCLDFFQNLLTGLDKDRIDYNTRQRDRRVEIDRLYAMDKIEECIVKLREVSSIFRIAPILVNTDNCGLHREAWCGSSLVRELEFLHSHTIHHYSLIAMLLRFEGINPGEEFGVAPSTLSHWQKEAACAQ